MSIECNQVADLEGGRACHPVCPFPWTPPAGMREGLDCHLKTLHLPSEGNIDSAVCFARKPSPLGQPDLVPVRWKLRRRQHSCSWAVNRVARARPGGGEAPRLRHGPGAVGLGGYSGIPLTRLPQLGSALHCCTWRCETWQGRPGLLEVGAQF